MISDKDIGVEKLGATVEDTMQFLLAKFAHVLVGKITKNLDKSGNASSALRQSVSISFQDKGFELSLEDYYKYVDKGVRGQKETRPGAQGSPYKFGNKMPPPAMLKRYIASKGISIKGYSDQKKSLRKSIRAKKNNPLDRAAFAMAKAIQKRGIKGTHFYSSEANPRAFTILTRQAEKMLGKGVIFSIKND